MKTDCINWTGYVNKARGGYGYRWVMVGDKKKLVRAHRYAWEQAHGPIPDDLCVLHKCDNRRCVNLEHLELGTTQKNTQQKMERGRHRVQRGENHGTAKLREAQVKEIKHYIQQGHTDSSIARMFAVTPTCISSIRVGRTWKHVG